MFIFVSFVHNEFVEILNYLICIKLAPYGRSLLFDSSTVEHQDARVLLLQRAEIYKTIPLNNYNVVSVALLQFCMSDIRTVGQQLGIVEKLTPHETHEKTQRKTFVCFVGFFEIPPIQHTYEI